MPYTPNRHASRHNKGKGQHRLDFCTQMRVTARVVKTKVAGHGDYLLTKGSQA